MEKHILNSCITSEKMCELNLQVKGKQIMQIV